MRFYCTHKTMGSWCVLTDLQYLALSDTSVDIRGCVCLARPQRRFRSVASADLWTPVSGVYPPLSSLYRGRLSVRKGPARSHTTGLKFCSEKEEWYPLKQRWCEVIYIHVMMACLAKVKHACKQKLTFLLKDIAHHELQWGASDELYPPRQSIHHTQSHMMNDETKPLTILY